MCLPRLFLVCLQMIQVQVEPQPHSHSHTATNTSYIYAILNLSVLALSNEYIGRREGLGKDIIRWSNVNRTCPNIAL